MENITIIVNGQDIHNIYSRSYSMSESRGKKRQHAINDAIINVMKGQKEYEGCEFKKEVRMNEKIGWGKSFAVDIQVFKNNKLIEIILGKAPASNLIQNHVNILGARGGEVWRLMRYIKDGIKVTFLTFQPNETPYFKGNGDVKHFEKNSVGTISEMTNLCGVNIQEVTVTFDIDGINTCVTKEDVKNLFSNDDIIKNIKVHI